jgi:hypothetical protein
VTCFSSANLFATIYAVTPTLLVFPKCSNVDVVQTRSHNRRETGYCHEIKGIDFVKCELNSKKRQCFEVVQRGITKL